MGYFDVYWTLLGSVLLFLMLAPFVPMLRRTMLDHREDPPLDLEPFEFYTMLLELMDGECKRSDFLGAMGLAAVYLISIFFAMIPPAMALLLWPVAALVLVLTMPFYVVLKLNKRTKKSTDEVSEVE
jgi:hypothetical protein